MGTFAIRHRDDDDRPFPPRGIQQKGRAGNGLVVRMGGDHHQRAIARKHTDIRHRRRLDPVRPCAV